MRKYLFLLIVLFLALFSCVDDNSSYEAQEKEKVDVEGVTPGGGEEEPPVDGELTPGEFGKIEYHGAGRTGCGKKV